MENTKPEAVQIPLERVVMLPCPFCGETDGLDVDECGGGDDWCVECSNCHVGQHAIHATKELAIMQWNKRAT